MIEHAVHWLYVIIAMIYFFLELGRCHPGCARTLLALEQPIDPLNATVYYGSVDCSAGTQAIVIPPGFFYCMCCQNSSSVAGVRRAFLWKGEHTLADYLNSVPSPKTKDAIAAALKLHCPSAKKAS